MMEMTTSSSMRVKADLRREKPLPGGKSRRIWELRWNERSVGIAAHAKAPAVLRF
jgi:hypothetical protein